MAGRKFIRSVRSGARSDGHRPRTRPACPETGEPFAKEPMRVKQNQRSPDNELLTQAVMLALRLKVIHRTTLILQRALLHLPCDRHAEVAERLRDGVCNPIAGQARLAEVLLKRLAGDAPLERSAVGTAMPSDESNVG